jgi:hypothetical protein
MLRLLDRLFGKRHPSHPVSKSAEDLEREAFYALFSGIKLRILSTAPAVPLLGDFGAPTRIGIAEDPLGAMATLGDQRPDACAVCGENLTREDRVPASLEPVFPSGVQYLMPVWVHRLCLESCPETEQQRGVPW